MEIDTTTSGSNLGDTTVAIRAVDIDSGDYCASTDATSPAYAGRCFSLTPTLDGAARVRLWARAGELNGIADVDLAVYRLTISGWGELGNRIVGNDGAGYRYAEGDAPGFSGFLLGEAGSPPVPVTLQSFEVVSFAEIAGLRGGGGFSARLLRGYIHPSLCRRKSSPSPTKPSPG